MSAWDDSILRDRDAFLEGLAKLGFTVSTPELAEGELEVAGATSPILMRVEVPVEFPYRPPTATPVHGDGGLSWHRETNGRLCLYTDADQVGLPWSEANAFVDRIREWFAADAAGWPDDPADLDLERYWDRAQGLLLYEDLDRLVGKPLRAIADLHDVYTLKVGGGGSRKRRHRNPAAAVVEMGELTRPVHNWDELCEVSDDVKQLGDRIRQGNIQLLLARYSRDDNRAVLVLRVVKTDPIEFRAMQSANTGDETMRLRAGRDAEALNSVAVAVVGVGAIGSTVADQLARAGVGRMTLVDGDTLRPGNCIRHVLDESWVGMNKAKAMAEHFQDLAWAPDEVTVVTEHLIAPRVAGSLLQDHDLVIDATAASRPSRLILDGSCDLDRSALSVGLQRDGGIARVDRSPLDSGETWHDATPEVPPVGPELREGGCGDPVSPTPAWACAHAASLAVAVATDLLLSRNQYGPTSIAVLVGQPDLDYRQVTAIR